eukprot:391019_1
MSETETICAVQLGNHNKDEEEKELTAQHEQTAIFPERKQYVTTHEDRSNFYSKLKHCKTTLLCGNNQWCISLNWRFWLEFPFYIISHLFFLFFNHIIYEYPMFWPITIISIIWEIIGFVLNIYTIYGYVQCKHIPFFWHRIYIFFDIAVQLTRLLLSPRGSIQGIFVIIVAAIDIFACSDNDAIYRWADHFEKGGDFEKQYLPIASFDKYRRIQVQDRIFYGCCFCCVWIIIYVLCLYFYILWITENPVYFNSILLLHIFTIMSVGFAICMCSILCCWNNQCIYKNIPEPKDYNQIITADSTRNYNAKFRAILSRKNCCGFTDYNRAFSIWTFSRIYLIWWIIADFMQLFYVMVGIDEYVAILVSVHIISIIIHCLCFYGLYKCLPLFIALELIITSLRIPLFIFVVTLDKGLYHIIIIMMTLHTLFLYWFIWKMSKWVQPLPLHDDNNNDIQKIESISIRCSSGTMDIVEDSKYVIECISTSTFPTLIANCKLTSGKWYYEVQLKHVTKNGGQIGWCTERQICASKRRIGTGHTAHGWSYDGYYKKKYHDYMETAYGDVEEWKNNDIIGCYLDLDNKTIRFSKNGNKLEFAFTNINHKNEAMAPSCSLSQNESFTIYFEKNRLKYKPNGYNAISTYFESDFNYKFDDGKKEAKLYADDEDKDKEEKYYNNETLDNESIQFVTQILSNAFCRCFNHDSFDINNYIYIHGGACRDAILNRGKGIKDIDLSVNINKLHQHAILCETKNTSKPCVLSSSYYKHKQEYEKVWEMTQKSASLINIIHEDELHVYRVKHPEEIRGTELLVGTLLYDFVNCDNIINTRYLLKQILRDDIFKANCLQIVGPKCKSIDVTTYTITLKNGVDIDIMDCQSFSSYRGAMDIIKSRMRWMKKNGDHDDDGFDIDAYKFWNEGDYSGIQSGNQIPFQDLSNVYPMTHKEHAKRVDCTFNALYIKLSSAINVDTSEWYNIVVDPYNKMQRADKDMNAIKDLQQKIVRPYRDAPYWSALNSDKSSSSSLLGSIASNAQRGQAEFLIFRVLKNAYKLKDQSKPIFISKQYRELLERTYSEWFDVNNLMEDVVYNGKEKINESKLERVLRHVFNHNYFKNDKMPNQYVIGIYHMLGYDNLLVKQCEKSHDFRNEIKKAVKKYDAQNLWFSIWKCGQRQNIGKRYYPINEDDDGTKLFKEYN